ncbi:MAG: hypothetical protein QGH06_06765 [Lutibacter sp.]|nr:hypothetical protein [Lutibacter sp.]
MTAQTEQEEIQQLIDSKRAYDQEYGNTLVYKIQLFNGGEQEAYKISRDCRQYFPTLNDTVIFQSPEWKTQVVSFKTRLEADRVLRKIKKKFSSAIVLKDRL